MTYPHDWPKCPSCGDFALDGHVTCGRVECEEHKYMGRQHDPNYDTLQEKWMDLEE